MKSNLLTNNIITFPIIQGTRLLGALLPVSVKTILFNKPATLTKASNSPKFRETLHPAANRTNRALGQSPKP